MKEKERKAKGLRGNLVSKNFGYQFRFRFLVKNMRDIAEIQVAWDWDTCEGGQGAGLTPPLLSGRHLQLNGVVLSRLSLCPAIR